MKVREVIELLEGMDVDQEEELYLGGESGVTYPVSGVERLCNDLTIH